PDLGVGDTLSVFEEQRVRQLRIGIGPGLIVVDGIWRVGVVWIGARPQRGDTQKFHHQLMVFLGGEGGRRRLVRAGQRFGGLLSEAVQGGKDKKLKESRSKSASMRRKVVVIHFNLYRWTNLVRCRTNSDFFLKKFSDKCKVV